MGLNGRCVGPDDVYLGLRGLRTLAVRLDRHIKSGLAVARWLEQRPEVMRLLHPAHGQPSRPRAVEAGFYRGIGTVQHRAQAGAAEGGATPSSIRSNCSASAPPGAAMRAWPSPFNCAPARTATQWEPGGPTVRFHIGLEAVEDLIADLERGFAALAANADE